MKNKKKIIISIIISILVLLSIIIFTNNYLFNDNRLSGDEKRWINENINNIQNIYVTSNIDIFSDNGIGIYHDLLNDFNKEYNIETNIISSSEEVVSPSLKLDLVKKLDKNDNVIYKDYYVIISKENKHITLNDINNSKIAVLTKDKEYINNYIKSNNIVDTTIEELFKTESDYIILSRLDNLSNILSNGYFINYHISDLNKYYVLKDDNTVFSSLLNKFINNWLDTNFEEYFYSNMLRSISTSLNITDTDIDKLKSIDYTYGFSNIHPYEVMSINTFSGITNKYLEDFSKLTNVKFNIIKYKNEYRFKDSIKDLDIYFNYNRDNSSYNNTTSGISNTYSVITNKDNDIVINSINGLINKDVYVLKDSYIHKYLLNLGNINIKTYDNYSSLYSFNKDNKVIIIDTLEFNYLSNNKLDNYEEKYVIDLNSYYSFSVSKDNDMLYRLFNVFLNITDDKMYKDIGIDNYIDNINHSNFINNITKIIIVIILLVIIVSYFIIKRSNKISIGKRIKKDEKMKFIDQLTSLKNRNYLSGFIKDWNNNKVYPQTIIVIDLNKIKEINDKYGCDEGDKQIQALANILIKMQLDNSEIMRSSGNEFTLYLVGYSQKQVMNYIHKLSKEIKKLPYEYGAEFGFSFIENDLKTIEDAINEAVEQMKKVKESKKDDK